MHTDLSSINRYLQTEKYLFDEGKYLGLGDQRPSSLVLNACEAHKMPLVTI